LQNTDAGLARAEAESGAIISARLRGRKNFMRQA
jgi:hypothetical protein